MNTQKQSGLGIINCTKLALNIKPCIKINNHSYQKIKYLVMIYNPIIKKLNT
jgi:hypothetical protein